MINIKFSSTNLFSEGVRFAVIAIFILCVFLMGGGSRDDIQSLIVLRPLSILFCGYALIIISWDQTKRLGLPFILLSLLMLLMLLQLVPLPFSIWSQFPQREIYAQIADSADLGQFWRPHSLSPSKTWNSLFSLFVPLATMLLFAIQSAKHQRQTFLIILGFGLLSALFGYLQIFESGSNIFSLYKVTNVGQPVGLYANQNHQALFLVCTLVILGWYVSRISAGNPSIKSKSLAALFAFFALIPIIIAAGSRAGLLIGVAALVLVFYLVSGSSVVAPLSQKIRRESREKGHVILSKRAWLAGASSLFVVVVFAILLFRSAALDQLFTQNPFEGLRSKLLPILLDMSWAYFPFGSGFGSFEHVYPQFETLELLNPRYLNQAHNDWVQFVIEGGLPAVILGLSFIFWLTRQIFFAIKNRGSSSHPRSMMAVFIILACGVASLVDYPIRVPSIMLLFSVCCVSLATRSR